VATVRQAPGTGGRFSDDAGRLTVEYESRCGEDQRVAVGDLRVLVLEAA